MKTFISDVLKETMQYYDAIITMMPKLLASLVILIVSLIIARLLRKISDRKLKQEMEDPLLARFLANMIRSIIMILGVLFALKTMGLGGITTSILAGAGITAFIIGFALRDIGENFLAGIIMAFKRPFRVGDFVESGAVKGEVIALNIRDTQIKTLDGKDVYVPNANIIKNPLINYTIDGFLRYDFIVSLPAGHDRKKAMRSIEEAVNSVDGVIKKRCKTEVYISGLSIGKLELTVSFWIDTFKTKVKADRVRSEVLLNVEHAINSL